MRIDSHQHFWEYNHQDYGWMGSGMAKLRKDHLPGDLAGLLKNSGIEGTVAVQARQSLQETAWLLELAEQNNFIKGVVGWVDLRSSAVDSELELVSSSVKLKGIRHVLQDENDDRFMLREDFLKGISRLEKFNLTYDILIFPRHIKYAVELVKRFPEQAFVIDHIAKPFIKDGTIKPWQHGMRQLGESENVYCKISGMVTEASWNNWTKQDFIPYMESVLEIFGVKRLMFGSDWPVCTLAAEYEEVFEIVAEFISNLSSDEQSNIMGLNAENFYHLKTQEASEAH